MFNINFKKLIAHNLPSFLRREKMKAWLYALVQPIEAMHQELLSFREQKFIELQYNAQTMLLEKALNDNWPNAQGNIYIDNTTDNLPDNFIYRDQDNLPAFYIYQDSDNKNASYLFRDKDQAKFDFIVYVPNSLSFSTNTTRKFVNQYRKAGKRFIIKTY